jgi:8-oxo-dGTP pyrophosphatase MutT (NUDIX family)
MNPNTISEFIKKISIQLLQKLPGLGVQLKMAPPFRGPLDTANSTTKQSAVLLLLYPENNIWHTVFIQRSTYKGIHSAQISMPGGQCDTTDYSKTYTALRETYEEIGIAINDIKILGSLTPLYIPPSNFMATCVVGYTTKVPQFVINKNEVQQAIAIPINVLFDNENKITTTANKSDDITLQMQVPAYTLTDKHFIWGATAMMLAEFEEIYTHCK